MAIGAGPVGGVTHATELESVAPLHIWIIETETRSFGGFVKIGDTLTPELRLERL